MMNTAFQMGMNPIIQVWFVCKLCKCSFQKVDQFIEHKKEKHYNEFQKIRCIIFEEKTLDQEFSKSFNVNNFSTEFPSAVSPNEDNSVGSSSKPIITQPHQFFRQLNTQELENVYRQEQSSFANHRAGQSNNLLSQTTTVTERSTRNYAFTGLHSQGGSGSGSGTAMGVVEDLNTLRFNKIEAHPLSIANSDLIVHSQTQVNDNVTFNVSVPVLPHQQSRLNFEINELQPIALQTFSPNTDNNSPHNNTPASSTQIQIKGECGSSSTGTQRNKVVCHTFSKLNFELDPNDLSNLVDHDSNSENCGTETSTSDTPYQCKLCVKKFSCEREVKIHIKHCWVHNKQKHRYCVLCKKSFFDPFAYRRHILRFHATEEEKASRPKFTCYFCPKEFTEKSSLKKHFLKFHVSSHKSMDGGTTGNSNTNNSSRPFCDRDRPFSTKQPNSSSSKSSNFQEGQGQGKLVFNPHHITHHTEERQFKCTQHNCTKTFTRSYHLTRHMVQKHSEEGDFKKFRCETCNKTFSTKSLLQNHSSVHTQDKPYKCAHVGCSSAFKRKDVLVQHEKIHTGEKPHKCESCGKAFAKRFSYLKHAQTHLNNQNQHQSIPVLAEVRYSGS